MERYPYHERFEKEFQENVMQMRDKYERNIYREHGVDVEYIVITDQCLKNVMSAVDKSLSSNKDFILLKPLLIVRDTDRFGKEYGYYSAYLIKR
jgi:hypothetical protein